MSNQGRQKNGARALAGYAGELVVATVSFGSNATV